MDRWVMKVVIGILAGGFVPFIGAFFLGGIAVAIAHGNFFIGGVQHGLAFAGWGMVAGAIASSALVLGEAISHRAMQSGQPPAGFTSGGS